MPTADTLDMLPRSARDEAEPDRAGLRGVERREAERVIAYWARKIETLGPGATVAALDLGEIDSDGWAHRFVIAVDPVLKNSSLLLYGANFARLLSLPRKGAPHLPMFRQLPRHYTEVFMRGCSDAHDPRAPRRLEGEVRRDDGRREFYRAAFIPVGVKANSRTHLAFGAFNSCLAARALAA
jgi:hypothetical protein